MLNYNRLKHVSIHALSAIALAFGATSCSNDNSGDDNIMLLSFYNTAITYDDATGAWTDCYDASAEDNLVYVDFKFSHIGETLPEYKYFEGFCPTVSTDTKSYSSTTEWLDHQWSSIAGGGVVANSPYMVAKWAEYLETDATLVPETPSCGITTKNNKLFKPVGCYVTNTSWGYYAMKNGTEMTAPFGESDTFELHIIGAIGGRITGSVTVPLAAKGQILKTWEPVSLTSLGTVDMVYFRMSSTQKNQWGILNPTYFCLDGFMFEFAE